MPTRDCDVALVTDARFSGGTAQAFRTDVLALRAAGLRVGLRFFRTGRFFPPEQAETPALLDLRDLDGVVVDPGRCHSLFLHNPQIFGAGRLATGEPLQLPACERLFMVAHHPPILGNGALCYDPISTGRAVRRQLPHPRAMEWLPISGLVREQLRSFQPLLALAPEDWGNSFDTADWQPQREKLGGPELVIGRHGRAHPDKWPDRAADIAASLPAGPGRRIRVLGADPEFFARRGVDTGAWELLPFGTMAPAAFLDGLDVFSYFHAASWREAFGRTIAEAMMMGLRAILDPHLRPTFGPHALYCRPDEVADLLARIQAEPAAHRAAARDAGAWCRTAFDARDLAPRLERLRASAPRRLEPGPRSTGPRIILRKWIGFHRRERAQEQPT